MTELILPHGGELKELVASPEKVAELKSQCVKLPSHDLTTRQLCDLELLMHGGFSPLTGFMGEKDYQSVVDNMKLQDGNVWPIPITLDVSEEFAQKITKGGQIALRSPEGVALAIMNIADVWHPDLLHEAEKVYGTTDKSHPGVSHVLEKTGPVYVGGSIIGLEKPEHHSFKELRHTPAELRQLFAKNGWNK